MKLTSRSRHAVRLALEVYRGGGEEDPVRLSEIAMRTGISKKFLEQLAMALKSHGLLRGVVGRKGGYLLARPAAEITIGQVLEAVMGPLSLSACEDDPEKCMFSDICECRMIWMLLRMRIREVLDGNTLADIADEEWLENIRTQVECAPDADAPVAVQVGDG